MGAFEQTLLVVSVLLLLSIISSKTSSQLGVPALLLFLSLGMLAGSDGPGGIYFDNAQLAQSLGVLALAFILFSGGLETDWQHIRPVLASGMVLATLGVMLTAGLVGLFATLVLGFSPVEGLLLGAVVSSTDAAAVFAILRSRNVGLKGSLKPLLELESGSNDPMAVLLTVALLQLLTGTVSSPPEFALTMVRQLLVGAAAGWFLGKATAFLVNRLRLEYEGLYPVLTLAMVLLTYAGATAAGGNGFLAVYVAGLTMGSGDFIHRRSLTHFHDGLAWIMQIIMFLVLGLLVFPSRLIPIIPSGVLLALFLMLVARPAAVFVCLARARMELREKLLVAWVGLRGAAPIILATFPLVAGVARADSIFNLVFFIVLASVLLQGTTIPLVAKRLGVDAPLPLGSWQAQWLKIGPTGGSRSELAELTIPAGSQVAGRSLLEAGIPKGALAVLHMSKGGGQAVPHGSTILEAGDTLLVFADRQALAETRAIIQATEPESAVER